MNTITVTLDLTEENLMKLKTLINSSVGVVAKGETISVPDPMPTAKDSDVPWFEEPEKSKEDYTKSDLRAAALKLSKAGKQTALAKIFKDNGGKKLSDFDERPEVYGAMIKAIEEALNA